MSTILAALPRRSVVIVAATLAVVVAAAVTVYELVIAGPAEYQITADFSGTPGLYAHNAVDILGVPTGHIVTVRAEPGYVKVVMAVPDSVKIPAKAKAVLVSPNPVSDRFVQLTPAYTKGPVMARGATIPLADTVVPLELDQIYSSVDSLSKALGPSGANKDGSLSAALHAIASLVNGNGATVHQAISQIAAALPALTAHPGQLSQLIDSVDSLTEKLAAREQTIDSLYTDLSQVTTQFADERSTIAAAITNLQSGMSAVATFLRANQSHIGSAIQQLNTTVAAIMSEQSELIKTFDTAPLGFQNFNQAITTSGPCLSPDASPHDCTDLWARLDLPTNAAAFVQQYCGSNVVYSFAPVILADLGLGSDNATQLACAAQIGLVQGHKGAPGAPPGPDFDLAHYLGRH